MTPESTSLRSAREDAIDALCRGFAEDAMSMQELERRLTQARAARTRDELDALLQDLRGPVRTVAPAAPAVKPAAKRAPEELEIRPSRHLAVAIMGGTRRAGRWTPPSSVLAMALMGGVELDFTEAEFTGSVVEVTCFALWGGVEVKVPPGVRVETHGFALMGGFDQVATRPEAARGPTVRVNGFALMGGVEVKVVDPETGKSKKRSEPEGW